MNLISNKLYKKILKEEIYRAKRILREYNESSIWKKLPTSIRTIALQSADEEMGADFAKEYADENDWTSIPDVITTRINIADFDIPDEINPYTLAEYIEENSSKLPSNTWYDTSVGRSMNTQEVLQYLRSGLTSYNWVVKNVIGHMKLANPKAFGDIDYNSMKMSTGTNNLSGISISRGTEPSSHPFYKGGAHWTGD
jgi:hypothetical protein